MNDLPNTRRLWMLLVPALAYLVWASYFRSAYEISLVDGSIGVLLGLYICSQPAANGRDHHPSLAALLLDGRIHIIL